MAFTFLISIANTNSLYNLTRLKIYSATLHTVTASGKKETKDVTDIVRKYGGQTTSTAPGTDFSMNYYAWYIPWERILDIKCSGKAKKYDTECSEFITPEPCNTDANCQMIDKNNRPYAPSHPPWLDIEYKFFNISTGQTIIYPQDFINLYP